MDIQTKMVGENIEVQFTDSFMVKDFTALVKIAEALNHLRIMHAIKVLPD